jgi:DNA-binding NtrC family response regulator
MADTLMLANTRPARYAAPSSDAIELVGRSAPVTRVHELLRRSAAVDSGVLLVGERGAEMSSVARTLHARSRPPTSSWIAVACGAADAARLDRTLFGVSPAHAPRDLESVGADSRIAAARGGTLFLQDVTELPSALQTRLARVIRDGEVRIEGLVVPTEIRFVASALPTIDSDVREQRFRLDLYRRLAVSRIDLPPLRDRLDDVPVLAARLLEDRAAADGRASRTFSQAALALLAALNWPGNIAELREVVDRVAAETPEDVIQIEQLLPLLQLDRVSTAFLPAGNLRDARIRFEREYIAAVLQHHGWRMAEAAQTLGIQRPNLYRKARQLGIPVARTSE